MLVGVWYGSSWTQTWSVAIPKMIRFYTTQIFILVAERNHTIFNCFLQNWDSFHQEKPFFFLFPTPKKKKKKRGVMPNSRRPAARLYKNLEDFIFYRGIILSHKYTEGACLCKAKAVFFKEQCHSVTSLWRNTVPPNHWKGLCAKKQRHYCSSFA